MHAAPADQRLLLDLADADARLRRADKAKQSAPQADRVRELQGIRQTQSRALAEAAARRDSLRAEIARIESDVAIVDARTKRDDERLAQAANSKDAQGLQSELASLARRKRELEDAELAVMEQLEAAEAAVVVSESAIALTNDEGARLSTEAKAHVSDAVAAAEQAARDRAAVATRVPAELLAAYERTAGRSGTGAAALKYGTCEACRMLISGSDLKALRAVAPDEVANCPECGTILVRTEESGL